MERASKDERPGLWPVVLRDARSALRRMTGASQITVLNKVLQRPPQRISASCFRTLSHRGELVFFRASPDSIITALEIAVTPPPAAAARLDSAPIPLPEKKSARPQGARARRSSVQGHRADPGLDGLSRRLRRHGEISVGDAALDRDRLDPLPGVRADHDAGDDAGFAAVCDADQPARAASAARPGDARLVAVLHLRPAVPADRGSFRHRLRRAAVRHRAVDHLSRREGRPAPLDRDRASAWSASSSSCGRAPARFIPPRSFRWSRRWPGPAR